MAENGTVSLQLTNILSLLKLEQDDTFAREAAYNLSLIFVITGATPLAEALYRRWLSI